MNSEKKLGNNIFNVSPVGTKKDKIIVHGKLKSLYYVSVSDFTEEELKDIEAGILSSFQVFIPHIDPVINKNKVASYKLAKQESLWSEVEKLKGAQTLVSGKIISATKGGYNVLLSIGINAFLPTSHIDQEFKAEQKDIINSSIEVFIIGVNRLHRNIVVSRKEVINQEIVEQNKDKLEDLQEGTILEGIIRGIYSGGLFVNVGIDYIGSVIVEEAVFNTDIVQLGLQLIYSVGQRLKFYVTGIDEKNKKISLSINKCVENPIFNYKNGQPIDVQFYKIHEYDEESKFMIIGLTKDQVLCKLNSDYCSYTRKEVEEKISSGEKIKVIAKNVDENNSFIQVYIKKSKENLWQEFNEKYQESEDKVFEFKVIGKSKYVIFLYYKGINAVLPINEVDISNTNEVFEKIKVGSKLDVYVVACDFQNYNLIVTRRFLKREEAKSIIQKLSEEKQVVCTMLYQLGLRIVVSVNGVFDVVIHSRKISSIILNKLLKESKSVNLFLSIHNLENLSVKLFEKRSNNVYRNRKQEKEIVLENTIEDISFDYLEILKEIDIAKDIKGKTHEDEDEDVEEKNSKE